MEAILCDQTALDYWRQRSEPCGSVASARRTESAQPKHKGAVRIDTPSAASVADLASWGLVDRDKVCLLVTKPEQRRRLLGVSYTTCHGPFPANSFEPALARVFVTSPELLFVLLAKRLSFVQLLEVGFELCGSYRLMDGIPSYDLEPLTTAARLRSFAKRAEGIHGRTAAIKAAQWIVDGSGSPAETALAIVFGLPCRYGGYGLGGFLLNSELALNAPAAHMLGRDALRPDFYWPAAKYPAEYDSSLYHSSRDQAEYDERRRNAYAAMGTSVAVIRPRHLIDSALLDEAAASIRKNIGQKQYRLPAMYAEHKSELHAEAFRYWIDIRSDYGTGETFLQHAAVHARPPLPW